MQTQIIKETKDYIVINKPTGLMVHADGRTNEETLCDILLAQYPEIKDVGEPLLIELNGKEQKINRPGIVHRLDRETSGVMLVARTQEGFNFLKEKFQKHEIQKTYHAFVYGNIKEDTFEIDLPIARSKKDFRQWFAISKDDQKINQKIRGDLREAKTFIKVLNRANDKSFTYIEAKPVTGRTHQIRVHMKSRNNPIVCDEIYANTREALLGFERLALHSFRINFVDKNGQKVEYEAPLPNDFNKALRQEKMSLPQND